MHEMVLIHTMLDAVLEEAASVDASSVKSVSVTIGEATDIVGEFIEDLFRFLSRGTLAENASLNIRRSPLAVQCNRCGATFPIKINREDTWTCQQCTAYHDYHLVSGREFRIDSIEVIDEADKRHPRSEKR